MYPLATVVSSFGTYGTTVGSLYSASSMAGHLEPVQAVAAFAVRRRARQCGPARGAGADGPLPARNHCGLRGVRPARGGGRG